LSDESLNLFVSIVGLAVVSPVVYVAEAPSPRDNRVVETSLPEHLHLLRCNVHAVVARVRSLERDDLTHVLAPPIGWLIRPRAPPRDYGGSRSPVSPQTAGAPHCVDRPTYSSRASSTSEVNDLRSRCACSLALSTSCLSILTVIVCFPVRGWASSMGRPRPSSSFTEPVRRSETDRPRPCHLATA